MPEKERVPYDIDDVPQVVAKYGSDQERFQSFFEIDHIARQFVTEEGLEKKYKITVLYDFRR